MTLLGTAKPLAQTYDVALLDLDGVVYIGEHAVPGAPEALASARALGMRLAFVTNNAARPPATVAGHLTDLGIVATPEEVINSAQAAAHHLAEMLPAGARVLVVGTVGLDQALTERGLRPVYSADEQPAAVVQGYSPDLTWAQLAEGAVAIRSGVPWVATNVDPTVPSPRGPLPGNGSMVAALRHATGITPVVTGKPDPMMHRESVQRSRAQNPLVVGDRLDTDIEGANAVGCASLFVLSGVTSTRDLIAAAPLMRPTYLARDVGGLLEAHPGPTIGDDRVRCGRWLATSVGDVRLSLTTDKLRGGAREFDDLDPLRALCAAAWGMSPESSTGRTGSKDASVEVRPGDGDAAKALARLGLAVG
jgi:glycerol-1-phosphatase